MVNESVFIDPIETSQNRLIYQSASLNPELDESLTSNASTTPQYKRLQLFYPQIYNGKWQETVMINQIILIKPIEHPKLGLIELPSVIGVLDCQWSP